MGPKDGVSKVQKKIEDMSQGILPTDIFEKSAVIQISRIQSNLIVGKGGSNIIKLVRRTETCIDVLEDSTKDVVKLTCMGSKDGVTMAMQEIENTVNCSETISMMIPKKFSALVIQNLESIKCRTGISGSHVFKVKHENFESKIEIAGNKDQIEKAREAIQKLVKES